MSDTNPAQSERDLHGPSLLTMDGFFYAITVDPSEPWQSRAVPVAPLDMKQIADDLTSLTIEQLKDANRRLNAMVGPLMAENARLREELHEERSR